MKLQDLFDVFKVRSLDGKDITISAGIFGLTVYFNPRNNILHLDVVNGDLLNRDTHNELTPWELKEIMENSDVKKSGDGNAKSDNIA